MTDPWLTPPQQSAWVRLAALMELLPRELDAQLRRDADLTHFEYRCMSLLSEVPERTLQLSVLARDTAATLARLSHVISRLESRGYLRRVASTTDSRATDVVLTDAGWDKVVQTAPGHVRFVREMVIDPLDPTQITQLRDIADAILRQVDPHGKMADIYRK